MDAAGIAVLFTATTGGLLGAAGFVQSRRRDTTAAENTAKDVASRAAEAAVSSLNAALDRLQSEYNALLVRTGQLEAAVEKCQSEKDEQATRHAEELAATRAELADTNTVLVNTQARLQTLEASSES